MPDLVNLTTAGGPFAGPWYDWGVFLSVAATLAATIWLLWDSRQSPVDATPWVLVTAIAASLGVPALLARLDPGFASDSRDSLALFAYVSLLAAFIAAAAIWGYLVRRASPRRCPICGEMLRVEWTQCPYHTRQINRPAHQTASGAVATRPPVENRHVPATLPALRPIAASRFDETTVPLRSNAGIRGERQHHPDAYLLVTTGPDTSRALPLRPGVTRIGRDVRVNDFALTDDTVSAVHLSIRYQDDRFVATDLDSVNGTLVNGARIERQILSSNDVLAVGRTRLLFVELPRALRADEKVV